MHSSTFMWIGIGIVILLILRNKNRASTTESPEKPDIKQDSPEPHILAEATPAKIVKNPKVKSPKAKSQSQVVIKGEKTVRYTKETWEERSTFEMFKLYEKQSDAVNYRDKNYLQTLINASTDVQTYTSVGGKDVIYKKIGECYEAMGDDQRAVENWEMAQQINPNVKVKVKLANARKRILS